MKKENAKLWLDGTFSFVQNFRMWLIWAFPFILVDFISSTLLDRWEPQKSIDDKLDLIWPLAVPFAILFTFLQYYFFVFFFLRQEPLDLDLGPKLSWQNIFYSMANFGVIIVIIFVPFFTTKYYLNTHFDTVETSNFLLYIAELSAASIVSIYLAIRCFAVMPLAVSNFKSVLSKSWRITSGNIWRAVWNIFLWSLLIVSPVELANTGIKKLISTIQPASESIKLLTDLCSQFLDSAISIILTGCFVAFICASFRVLYRENELKLKKV